MVKMRGKSEKEEVLCASLKACAQRKDLHKGCRLHGDILKHGLHLRDMHLGNTLIHMYAQCGALGKAREVFDELNIRDAVSWNVLVAGYAQNGSNNGTLCCFEEMKVEGLSPNEITIVSVLKSCASLGDIDKGKDLHAHIIREQLLEKDAFVGAALVDMYAKCGMLVKAQEVFDELQHRDVASWTALIGGYAQHGQGKEALDWFEKMQEVGLFPNVITLVCILKACGTLETVEKGKILHAKIVREGLLENNVLVGTALVDMYMKCGSLEEAQSVFLVLGNHDEVCWSALIAGLAQQGHGDKALYFFDQMQHEGFPPNTGTLISILKGCGTLGAADKGKQIHAKIMRKGLFKNDSLVCTALVDMYAKSGELEKAQELFDLLPIHDLVSWTALIVGYAHSHGERAVKCFELAIRDGLCPDAITLSAVLIACSHSGLVDKGLLYFKSLKHYGIDPSSEHYTCMIGLFSRTGDFDKAAAMIMKMPASDHIFLWATVLSSCQKWGHLKLGKWAFESAIHFDRKDPSFYASMDNIYAAILQNAS